MQRCATFVLIAFGIFILENCGQRSVRADLDDGAIGDLSLDCRWRPMHTGTNTNLTAVWGSSPGNVFTTGQDGTVVQYDGEKWRTLIAKTGKPLVGIWGSGSRNVYAVAYSKANNIVHYDGKTWKTVHSESQGLHAVWGTTPNNVYVVGAKRTVLHYDGKQWTKLPPPPAPNNLSDVWVSQYGDVYVVGEMAILFYDGKQWQNMAPTGTMDHFIQVFGDDKGSVFVLAIEGPNSPPSSMPYYLMKLESHVWSKVPLPASAANESFTSIGGDSAGNMFLAGSNGALLRFDGSKWRREPTGTVMDLGSIWSSGPTDVFVTGEKGIVLHFSCEPRT